MRVNLQKINVLYLLKSDSLPIKKWYYIYKKAILYLLKSVKYVVFMSDIS